MDREGVRLVGSGCQIYLICMVRADRVELQVMRRGSPTSCNGEAVEGTQ